ncbi:hypothetical protein ACWDRX_24860, partial [Streptomyces nigra]
RTRRRDHGQLRQRPALRPHPELVVLGQAAPGVTVADLTVGMEVEVVPGVLHEDTETTWTTWQWRPTGVGA